jgi:hypothetical protein
MQEISTNNLNRHFGSKQCRLGVKYTGARKFAGVNICPHCQVERVINQTNISFSQHIVKCHKNLDATKRCLIKVPGVKPGTPSYKKGRTKETDPDIRKQSDTLLKLHSIGAVKKYKWSDGDRLNVSLRARQNNLGGYRPHPNRGQRYKDIWFDSKWEVKVAISLDENNIQWQRPKVGFIWNDGGQKYFPDFYLPEYDVYLDPKNPYLQVIDKVKIDETQRINGIRVFVLNEHQLEWKIIKTLIAP